MNEHNHEASRIAVDVSSLYTTRVIVLMETAPQSNEYRQILLNPAQFKAFTYQITSFFPAQADFPKEALKEGDTAHTLLVSDKTVILPENIREMHTCPPNKPCSC